MKTRLQVILLLALASSWLVACNPQYAEQQGVTSPSLKRVKASVPPLSTEPIPVTGSGLLASKKEVRLSFKTGGVIRSILVDEGDLVRKGQVLARLDLQEINARVRQASQQVERYERDLARIERLHADSVATLEQVQNLRTALEVAKADLQVAAFNQEFSVIRAPEQGKILRRFTEVGEVISSGNPVFYFANRQQRAFVMRIGVADRDVVRLQNGDPAILHFDAWPATDFSAQVTEVAEAADPMTGTFEIELTLDPTDRTLKNGFIGKASIRPRAQAPYYKVPMRALVDGEASRARVFAVDKQQQVHKVELRPDYIGNDYFTVVAAEQQLQEPLVIEGAAYLSEGETVEILKP